MTQPANGNGSAQEPSKSIEKKKPTRMDVLKNHFDAWTPTLKAILPRHIEPERVIKIAMNVYLNKPELAQCTPLSMVKATMQCAELGLDPSPLLGEAYFVPFRAKVQVKDGNLFRDGEELRVSLMPGYVGLAKLVKQTGDVADVYAVPVYESEAKPEWDDNGRLISGFYVEEGTVRKIHHIRNLKKDRGELFAVYGVVKFKDDTHHFEVLSRADIEEHRKVSQQADGPAWKNHYVAMACKTAIRMAVKMVPKSPDKPLAKALAFEERQEIGGEAFGLDLASDAIDTTGETAPDTAQAEEKAAEKATSRTDELNSKLGPTPTPTPTPTQPRGKAPPHDPSTGELLK